MKLSSTKLLSQIAQVANYLKRKINLLKFFKEKLKVEYGGFRRKSYVAHPRLLSEEG